MIQKYKKRSDQEWRHLIQECRTSGQSDKDWCEEHAICFSTFYNKISKFRKEACDIPVVQKHAIHRTQHVVPLEILNECESSVAYKTQVDTNGSNEMSAVALNIHGYRIEIANHAAKETIFNTLSVLQQLC